MYWDRQPNVSCLCNEPINMCRPHQELGEKGDSLPTFHFQMSSTATTIKNVFKRIFFRIEVSFVFLARLVSWSNGMISLQRTTVKVIIWIQFFTGSWISFRMKEALMLKDSHTHFLQGCLIIRSKIFLSFLKWFTQEEWLSSVSSLRALEYSPEEGRWAKLPVFLFTYLSVVVPSPILWTTQLLASGALFKVCSCWRVTQSYKPDQDRLLWASVFLTLNSSANTNILFSL